MIRSTGAIWSSSRLNPSCAARRIDSKLPAPIHSGGCGCWTGRGSMTMLSKCQRLPWCEKRSPESPGLAQERQGLVEALGRLLDGDAEARELRRAVALADAEIEAAVGQEIERGDLLGQQHRVVPGQHHHRRAEPYALGAAGKVAQEIERRRELPDAREVVLDHEHAVIAELLGVQHVVDVLGVAEAVSDRPFTRRLGSAEQPELHMLSPLRSARLAQCDHPYPQPRVAELHRT